MRKPLRKLSNSFIVKLNGELKPLMDYVLQDKELDLQIRDNYINIYYKGGNILKIKIQSCSIDEAYFKPTKTYDPSFLRQLQMQMKINKSLDLENIKLYFEKTKKAMDEWDEYMKDKKKHEEKKEQQLIALANRNDTDYVVLDLEYEVSTDSEFNYDGNVEGKTRPRFDIIAIHNSQIVVIELKKGLGAIEGKSGIEDHLDSYKHTIGRDYKKLFVAEMRELLKQKQDLEILDKSLSINDDKPEFIFAFSEEESKNEFSLFAKKCCEQGYNGKYIKIDSDTHKLKQAYPDKEFSCKEQERQIELLQNEILNKELFDGASGNGWMYVENKKKRISKWKQYPQILQHKDSLKNLYRPIRAKALYYFKHHGIAWWRENEDRYFPTGHLLSSQINCINHLFALRKDKDAVLAVINKATNMEFDEVLPLTLDNDGGYIAFEFAYKNDEWLGENDKGARRGVLCTSIDAMIEARKGEEKWLIPIEWKYTENYEKEDKTNKKRLERYGDKIKHSLQLIMPENGDVAHSVYFHEPCYELMRQTLLVEQLKQKGYANNFFHINVIPEGNTELRKAVEKCYIPNLKDKSKFRIIDPQELLSPLQGNDDYKELLNYLETRYWNS